MPNSKTALKQQQKQQLKLSPQQIQTFTLLPLTSEELEKRIEEEIDQNPLLEDQPKETSMADDIAERSADVTKSVYRPSQFEDLGGDYDTFIAGRESIQDSLCYQIDALQLSKEDCRIAKFIVGSVNDLGFLQNDLYIIKSDLYLNENINAEISHIESIRKKVMGLDPMGVGSISAAEFLILQLDTLPKDENVLLAKRILKEWETQLADKQEDAIIRGLNISGEAFAKAMKTIRHLSISPIAPGTFQTSSDEGYIRPEFRLVETDGKLVLEKINDNIRIPHLRKENVKILDELSKKPFLTPREKQEKEKLQEMHDKAVRFIQSLQERQVRLYKTVKTIVEMQKEYFLSGDKEKIKPMKLEDIANSTSQDISTVSRIVSQKYIDTSLGIICLRKLFSGGIATVDNRTVSSIAVCSVLSDIIKDEDPKKPLSDEELTKILQKRFIISRRTVAKYRDSLNIKSSHERKRQ